MRAPEPSDTAPPKSADPMLAALKKGISNQASNWLLPLVQRVARDHIGGETLDDAMSVARRLAREGYPNTLGFWDTPDYTMHQVANIYLQSIKSAAANFEDSYISIKPPALGFDPELAAGLAIAAGSHGIRLHCDSHGPDMADRSCTLIDAMRSRHPSGKFGTTLPGRWRRSLSDADWAIERDVFVRVVKGQWPDLADPGRDLRAGFLEVVDRLAGRARHVAVASHDALLVAEAVSRLRAAGTSCDVEVIHGGPKAAALHWARENRVGVRVYVAYGKGFIPNALRALRRNPRLAWWIVKASVWRS